MIDRLVKETRPYGLSNTMSHKEYLFCIFCHRAFPLRLRRPIHILKKDNVPCYEMVAYLMNHRMTDKLTEVLEQV